MLIVAFAALPAEKVLWSPASVCVSVCHARRCLPPRDCRLVALVSAAKVMRCIQCFLVKTNFDEDNFIIRLMFRSLKTVKS